MPELHAAAPMNCDPKSKHLGRAPFGLGATR
jgi:hypothetical protein